MLLHKFIGGNSIQTVLPVANRMLKEYRTPIINYMIEHCNEPRNILDEYLNLIKHIDYQYKIAIKGSSFHFDQDMIEYLIEKSIEKNIHVLIDAEEGYLNDRYQEITDDLLYKHNKQFAYVIKTYQMYRKDSLQTLEQNIYDSQKNKYNLGIKLVRGAYHNSEKKNGQLFTEKELTDENYNKGILTIANHSINTYTILATHNKNSIELGYIMNRTKKRRIFEFANLMGMQENMYNNIIKSGNKVNVYIPYGPYSKMIPYLTRRLYENIDMIKYMRK